MYYMTYGNNDYRDYVMAHSLGEWKSRATKYIDKIVGPGGKVRYIYDAAKTGIQKHVTGSYYRQKASHASDLYRKGNINSYSLNNAYKSANKGYSRSLAGRAEAAGRSIRGLAKNASSRIQSAAAKLRSIKPRDVASNLIKRGQLLIGKIRRGYSDWKATRAANKKIKEIKKTVNKTQMSNEEKKNRAATSRIRNNWNRAALGEEEAKKRAVKKSRKARAYTY